MALLHWAFLGICWVLELERRSYELQLSWCYHGPRQKTFKKVRTNQYFWKSKCSSIKETQTVNRTVTTAVNSISFQFIARLTAAEKRAVGVDTGLSARVFTRTFIHIYGKPMPNSSVISPQTPFWFFLLQSISERLATQSEWLVLKKYCHNRPEKKMQQDFPEKDNTIMRGPYGNLRLRQKQYFFSCRTLTISGHH